MKVKDLIAELEKFEQNLDVKILSFHYPNEKLFHFTEKIGASMNLVSGHLDDIGTIVETTNNEGHEKEIYVCDSGAFGNMISGNSVRKRKDKTSE